MDLRDLLDVSAICATGSFRKAATTLGVTQPTLSNRIAYLEDKIGARLFERAHGRSRPTALAELIASRAAAIGVDAALLAKDIERLASGHTGIVRIGVGPAAGRALLCDVIDRVTARLPQLSLAIVFGSTAQLADQLLQRDLDIAICHPIEGQHPSIAMEFQLEIENVIVAHPDHLMFRRPAPGIRDLVLGQPIALPVLEQRYRDMIKQEYGVDFDQLKGRLVCSDFELLVRLVASSPHYFTAGPVFAFTPEIATGRLRVFDVPVPFKHLVAMHTNRDAYPLPAVAEVQEIIREAFATVSASAPSVNAARREGSPGG